MSTDWSNDFFQHRAFFLSAYFGLPKITYSAKNSHHHHSRCNMRQVVYSQRGQVNINISYISLRNVVDIRCGLPQRGHKQLSFLVSITIRNFVGIFLSSLTNWNEPFLSACFYVSRNT